MNRPSDNIREEINSLEVTLTVSKIHGLQQELASMQPHDINRQYHQNRLDENLLLYRELTGQEYYEAEKK